MASNDPTDTGGLFSAGSGERALRGLRRDLGPIAGLLLGEEAASEDDPADPGPDAGGRSEHELDELAADLTPHLDLDDLARRLYPRLRSRLRTELLVDRERAGLLTDLR